MKITQKARTLNFARQINKPVVGATKNDSTLRALAATLTPRQQRRLRKNGPIKVKA